MAVSHPHPRGTQQRPARDRSEASHAINLYDMQAKYADVLKVEDLKRNSTPHRLERGSVRLRSYGPVLFRNRTRSARPWRTVATDCAIASASSAISSPPKLAGTRMMPACDSCWLIKGADELETVGDVARDQAAALPGRVAGLLEIAAAGLPDLMRTGGIKAPSRSRATTRGERSSSRQSFNQRDARSRGTARPVGRAVPLGPRPDRCPVRRGRLV